MKFVNPRNAPPSDARVPYWDENKAAGLDGSIPPAKVLNDTQDEILKVITMAGLTPNPDDPTQLWQALSVLLAALSVGDVPSIEVPPGCISMFGAATPPTGWLKCNGQAVSRVTYAPLFTAIGTSWGAGDAINTFNVPDLRGEFVRGFDDGRNVDTGRAIASFQDWATAAPKTTTPARINGAGATIAMTNASNPTHVGFARPSKTGESVTAEGYDTGGAGNEMDSINVVTGDPETRPRNLAVLYIIKV
ncbi:phage tail protein [Mesorhizobium loti]|uniref:phage tail protein n=1 Tax=Rhizobium loti TaxID=381 RepID=UPI00042961DA|nr:phage tail protein [Mesorhizobium loti]